MKIHNCQTPDLKYDSERHCYFCMNCGGIVP